VVVNMGFLAVLLLFFRLAVVVGVSQGAVVVLVGVPGGAVLPLTERAPTMVMGDVIVVMAVSARSMRVLAALALALGVLARGLYRGRGITGWKGILGHQLPPGKGWSRNGTAQLWLRPGPGVGLLMA
jgi:hypothetical protein